MNRIYYYKLVSPYEEDVTKNCKLTIDELDSNFLSLKNVDIKEAKISEDKTQLRLVRNDGDEITVEMPFITNDIESHLTRDLNVEYDKGEGVITLSYNGDTVIINGLLTEENALKRVKTDDSLTGEGTEKNPLKIADLEKTGMFAPFINIINTVEGETLPEEPSVGDRYLTYEKISHFGYLYNFDALKTVSGMLEENMSEWRIPTKADWDALLNSIEPCEYQNHDSEDCHTVLGMYAGKILKSKDYWKEFTLQPYVDENGIEHLPVQPGGIDTYGFSVLPTGYGDEDGNPVHFTECAGLWTTTHLNDDEHQDLYVKIFRYDESGVRQEADCPDAYHGIRLVKDFDGSNFHNAEVILGSPYNTHLFNETSQIWTTINLYYSLSGGTLIPNGGEDIDWNYVYFLNSFNGKTWDKKELKQGDTALAQHGEHYDNEEYRVFVDENGNQYIKSVDDVVYDRVMEHVGPILENEREERIAADETLNARVDQEIADRTAADKALSDRIDAEEAARIAGDEALNARVDAEEAARIAEDEALNARIDAEEAARIAEDEALNARVDQEIADRTAADKALSDRIDAEEAARIAEDEALNARVDQEIADRTAADQALSDRIDAEEAARIAEDEALNARVDQEIIDRTEADDAIRAQLIDNPDNSVNANTPAQYIISSNSEDGANLTLYSKGGTNDIRIYFDGNYGELPNA